MYLMILKLKLFVKINALGSIFRNQMKIRISNEHTKFSSSLKGVFATNKRGLG